MHSHVPPERKRVYLRRRIAVFSVLGLVLLTALYCVGALIAPLPAAASEATAQRTITAAPASLAWPAWGSGAVAAEGHNGLLAQKGSTTPVPIASMTKTVTAQVVLDAKPIPDGSDGPTITFTQKDVQVWDDVLANGGSWAPVVAGEQLTERQALQAMLLPSANNYAISLAKWAYGSVGAFLTAANSWLKAHGFSDTHLADPAGLNPGSVSTPKDLVGIGMKLLKNPVLASIVKLKSVTLPGAGTQDNGNKVLGVEGIDGIKTGFTDEAGHCLLFSAHADIGSHPVTIVGVVLGAGTYDDLWASVPALLTSAKDGFHSVKLTGPSKGFGTFTTQWGASAQLVSRSKSSTLVWSDTPVTVQTKTNPVSTGRAGDVVGSVTFSAGTVTVTKPLTLASDIPDPGFWWRITHLFVLL